MIANLPKCSPFLVQKLPFFNKLHSKKGILTLSRPILLYKNTKSTQRSFVIRHALVPHLYNRWHYHKELELLYVIRSNGTRFVGDVIQPFFAGDMVLVGPNVPHFWQNDEAYFQGRADISAEAILLQFVDDFLGDTFQLPEMSHIKKLFARALHGIQFAGTTRNKAAELLGSMVEDNGKNKIIELMQLLDLLAKSDEYRMLSDLSYSRQLPPRSSERIQLVCEYLLQNYKQPIALSEVALVANMTEKAFCRFFKNSTQKTLVQFVTELRISYACKLLLESDRSVSEICFESGFNNLSNFNRIFKRNTGQTPKAYRRAMIFK